MEKENIKCIMTKHTVLFETDQVEDNA